jgi:hypothetical protein
MLVTQDKIENCGKEIRSVVSSVESDYKSFSYRSDFLMTPEIPLSGNVKCYVIETLANPSSTFQLNRQDTSGLETLL